MKFAELMKEVGVGAKDIVIQAGEKFVRDECRAAKAEQRKEDILRVVVTLSDAGIKEAELYDLLSKHWDIDSRAEAAAFIKEGRTILWPTNRLKALMERQGIVKSDWVAYKYEHQILKKLKNTPTLCELSDEKLKAAIEK